MFISLQKKSRDPQTTLCFGNSLLSVSGWPELSGVLSHFRPAVAAPRPHGRRGGGSRTCPADLGGRSEIRVAGYGRRRHHDRPPPPRLPPLRFYRHRPDRTVSHHGIRAHPQRSHGVHCPCNIVASSRTNQSSPAVSPTERVCARSSGGSVSDHFHFSHYALVPAMPMTFRGVWSQSE